MPTLGALFQQQVPASLWEQAGIVVLIFVIVIPGLFVAIRLLLNDQRRAQAASQQQLLEQQQQFIASRDRDWQSFFTNIRQTDGEAIKKLTEAIDKLVDRVESLEGKFDTHDSTEMEFLRSVVGNKSKTQPRKTG
jgi:L-lactate utilization protein LutB